MLTHGLSRDDVHNWVEKASLREAWELFPAHWFQTTNLNQCAQTSISAHKPPPLQYSPVIPKFETTPRGLVGTWRLIRDWSYLLTSCPFFNFGMYDVRPVWSGVSGKPRPDQTVGLNPSVCHRFWDFVRWTMLMYRTIRRTCVHIISRPSSLILMGLYADNMKICSYQQVGCTFGFESR